MRRRSVVGLSAASVALAAGIIGCGADITRPSGTLPVACVEAQNVPGTKPPGTDPAGSALPVETVEKPTVSIPVGPLPTKLETHDITVGDGAEVKPGDQVTVNYVGIACTTGKEFDSSYGKEPVTFTLDKVIAGWKEGMVGMKAGGRRALTIPGDMAYTDKNPPPQGSNIGMFEPLFFVVELIKTEAPPPTTTTTAPPATEAPPTTAAPGSSAPETTAAPVTTTTAPPK